eukprot:1241927-Pyramimonas_sp.AAC.1
MLSATAAAVEWSTFRSSAALHRHGVAAADLSRRVCFSFLRAASRAPDPRSGWLLLRSAVPAGVWLGV